MSDGNAPHEAHRARAPRRLRAALLTVSDSRTPDTDDSGRLAREMLEAAGHEVRCLDLLADEPEQVRDWLRRQRNDDQVDLIMINGGTGISHRDRTFEAVTAELERVLPGFGELFRGLSYEEIGAAAMASRAVAGVVGSTLVFSTPGSPEAVRLALDALILPEAPHLVGELRR